MKNTYNRYDDQEIGYPAGYFRIGCALPCKDRKVRKDTCRERRFYGPEGYWGI